MGNCQAAEMATVVIQHPKGRVERLYWPVSASEVMKNNPGHYVALVTLSQTQEEVRREINGVRITRVKLLRPKDTLILGQVYRLVTSQEVMKGLWAKKYERIRKSQSEIGRRQEKAAREARAPELATVPRPVPEKTTNQVGNQERQQAKPAQAAVKPSKQWRPSLHSISELTA